MRISDWSSDVCSSDLPRPADNGKAEDSPARRGPEGAGRADSAHHARQGAGVLRLMAGRPSKYQPAYCVEVISCLAEGHSVTAFAGRIGVARSSVFKWADEHPEFSDALKIGQAKATEFWEKILQDVATNGGGKAQAGTLVLKHTAATNW